MKANELMIGDWVQFHHKGVKKISEAPTKCKTVDVDYVGQIKGIYVDVNNEKGELAVKTLPNEYEKVIGLHMVRDFVINPIPLTKEILEKNGFKKDERNENYYKWNWYILEDNASYDMETGIVRIFKASNLTFCHPIGYVHELQNALRLCEVDKEIIL